MQQIDEWIEWRKNLRFLSPRSPQSCLSHLMKVDGVVMEDFDFDLSCMHQAIELAYRSFPEGRDKKLFEAFYLYPRNLPVKTIAASAEVDRGTVHRSVKRTAKSIVELANRFTGVAQNRHKIERHTLGVFC